MHLTTQQHSSALPNSTSPPTLAELLQAHDVSRTQGEPLLTETGVQWIAGHPGDAEAAPLPVWNREDGTLTLGGRLLKRFNKPAPSQRLLLDAFQEQGWVPTHIDDPLPGVRGKTPRDAKRRLHTTINNLNRSLPPGTIRFHGDGTGQAIVWEYCSPDAAGNNRRNDEGE